MDHATTHLEASRQSIRHRVRRTLYPSGPYTDIIPKPTSHTKIRIRPPCHNTPGSKPPINSPSCSENALPIRPIHRHNSQTDLTHKNSDTSRLSAFCFHLSARTRVIHSE